MAVPKFDDFLYPFLYRLKDMDNVSIKDMKKFIIEHFHLTEEDCKLKTKGGSATQLDDRLGWSRQWLRRALFIENPQRGIYKITKRGLGYLQNHTDLRQTDLMKYPEYAEYATTSSRTTKKTAAKVIEELEESKQTQTPTEQLEVQKEYKYFVENCTKSPKSFNNYNAFTKINGLIAKLKGIDTYDIYTCTKSDELSKLISVLYQNEEFKMLDETGKKQYSNSLKVYKMFLNARDFFTKERNKTEIIIQKESRSLQQIIYGAPGTGKSYKIKKETNESDVIRTTFHPDTDYSTFVGAYKPTTALLPICNELGQPMKIGETTLHKEQIVYEFVAQSFLQAYVSAWKKYAAANENEPQRQYLVIEEINRGNCAQIFGDLFQLLDRNKYGFSDYPIKADTDMKRQLQKAFAGLSIVQSDNVNAIYENENIVTQVLNGDILLLPNNLYIWATMNTSDQNLFPIDSAFKRRWDWTYMPISNAKENWVIKVGGYNYDWWQFLEKINEKIGSTTNSEDKKLGYFFCKAQNGVISAKTFVGKVIFYLWNDVFNDYEFGDAIFNDEDGSKLSFDKFYTSEGMRSEIVEEKVGLFLQNLGVETIKESDDYFESDIEKDKEERESNDGKIRLTVKFPDGAIISGKTQFDSYIEALKKIGLEKAEKIASEKRYSRLGCALITKVEEQEILNAANFSYVKEQGFYIVKGISLDTMRNILKLISQQLNLQLEIN